MKIIKIENINDQIIAKNILLDTDRGKIISDNVEDALNELQENKLDDYILIPDKYLPPLDYIRDDEVNVTVVGLNSSGKIDGQYLPTLDFIKDADIGILVAQLDVNGIVKEVNIPELPYIKDSHIGIDIVPLNASGKIDNQYLPDIEYIKYTDLGVTVLQLDNNGLIPSDNLPELPYIKQTEKDTVVPSLSSTGKIDTIHYDDLLNYDYIKISSSLYNSVVKLDGTGKIPIVNNPDIIDLGIASNIYGLGQIPSSSNYSNISRLTGWYTHSIDTRSYITHNNNNTRNGVSLGNDGTRMAINTSGNVVFYDMNNASNLFKIMFPYSENMYFNAYSEIILYSPMDETVTIQRIDTVKSNSNSLLEKYVYVRNICALFGSNISFN